MRDRNAKKLKQEIDMKCKWGGCHLFAPVSEMSLAKKLELSSSKFYRYFIQITRTRESQPTSVLMIPKFLSGKFRIYFCTISFWITKRTKEFASLSQYFAISSLKRENFLSSLVYATQFRYEAQLSSTRASFWNSQYFAYQGLKMAETKRPCLTKFNRFLWITYS